MTPFEIYIHELHHRIMEATVKRYEDDLNTIDLDESQFKVSDASLECITNDTIPRLLAEK